MANRAYLYAWDSEDGNDWTLPDDGEYYDSRWTIPVAWWFLFGPADLRLGNTGSEPATWERLRFVADRSAAVARFRERRSLLDDLIGDHLDSRYVDYFISVLSAWPDRFLLMDPDEILEDDPHEDAATILPVLDDLERGAASGRDVLARFARFSGIEPEDRAEVLIVGYTYGPIAGGIWDEMTGLDQ